MIQPMYHHSIKRNLYGYVLVVQWKVAIHIPTVESYYQDGVWTIDALCMYVSVKLQTGYPSLFIGSEKCMYVVLK